MYRGLSDPRSIRLVWLQPDIDYASLSCRIEHFSLDEHPEYFALFYCWGDAADTRPISCNGGCLEVTTNLQAALYAFRERRKGRWFWIDVICIYFDRSRIKFMILSHSLAALVRFVLFGLGKGSVAALI